MKLEQQLSEKIKAGKNFPNAVLDIAGLINEEAAGHLHWAIPDYRPLVDAIKSVALEKGIDLRELKDYVQQVQAAGDPAAISLAKHLK